ncbi:hypothetical protein [Streptomyces sp. NPDC088182]|uniref:hypothetical protein n=1 Tax=Streptomyces sp. NPDC088182 TaxID=3365838 RepID=UPI0038092E03
MSDRFRIRPATVEARQVQGSNDGSAALELATWCGGWCAGAHREPKIVLPAEDESHSVARVGDWIVKDGGGRFSVVRGDVFAEAYEPAIQQPLHGFTRGFRLHTADGKVLDGAQFPSSRAVVVDDQEWGLATAAVSVEELLKGLHGARIEWPGEQGGDGAEDVVGDADA